MKTPSQIVATNTLLFSLALFFFVLTVKVVLFTPEFIVHIKYMYPDVGYDYQDTTTLTTPEPTSPVDYSNSSDVPPGYVVPPKQPSAPVPKE